MSQHNVTVTTEVVKKLEITVPLSLDWQDREEADNVEFVEVILLPISGRPRRIRFSPYDLI